MHEPLTRARLLANITYRPWSLANSNPHNNFAVAIHKFRSARWDAGTDAAAGAVAEMVAVVDLFGGGVDGREGREVGVAGRDELGGVLPAAGVVVEGPDVEDDGGVFGQVHTVCGRLVRGFLLCYLEMYDAGWHGERAYLRISRARLRGEAQGATCGLL